MLGRAGATVLGFALPLILTRLLPQAEFGTYKPVWLVVTTAYYMLQLGLAQSLYYFIPRKDGHEQVWLTQTTISLTVTGTLCAAALYAGNEDTRISSGLYLLKDGHWTVFQPPQKVAGD